MKRVLFAIAVTACAWSSAALAQDEPDERWYLTPSIGYLESDQDRNQEWGIWLGLGLGIPITDSFALEIEASADDGPLEGRIGKYEHLGLGVFGKYSFSPNADWRPFVRGGAGALNHSTPDDGGTNEFYSAGAGLEHTINDRGTEFRAEFRYRLDKDDETMPGQDDFEDWLFMVGVNVPLGSAAPPPPPPEVEPEQAMMDSDGDGVMDGADRCPGTPAGVAVDQYGCALDSDGDGVPDYRDDCPNTRSGALVDENGCEAQVIIELEGVHFAFDQATLRPDSIATLDAAVEILKKHARLQIVVAGHTDAVGSDAYNMDLSEDRAKVVYRYLVDHGIDANRMEVEWYGESRPIASNETPNGRAKNRRTELVIQGVDTEG